MTEIKFIIPWQMYSKGDVITPNAVLRDFLISSGFAELLPKKKLKNAVNREIKNAPRNRRRAR